ncbi:MAG TPA: hypothetical protein VGP08_24900 [Pyrinomonadaceae bacterium]|nr:hypothetical protein [Pyrinomonadaceae bacterium]
MIGDACATQSQLTGGGGSRRSHWELSMGFRKQRSHRHFVGTVEQKQREAQHTEIVNDIYLFDVALTYKFNPRTSVTVSIPMQNTTRVSPARFNAAGVQTSPKAVSHGSGIGDISVSGRVWLFDPGREIPPKHNISFAFGVKLPTGNEGITDVVNGRTVVVDQSIQAGDGGYGFAIGTDMYKRLPWRMTAFGSGLYLFNPRNTNGVRTGRGRPSEAIMSVSDQYLARAGVLFHVPKARGWTASFGARIEGVPVRDAFGKSDGFRRPGYAISLEPGVNYVRGKDTWSFSVPVPVERNRRQSTSDLLVGGHGDAAFADYLIVAGWSHRF